MRMRTVTRILTAGVLLGTAALAMAAIGAGSASADAPAAASGPVTGAAASGPAADAEAGRHLAIPVGGITDLGDLTKVARLGSEVTGLLGH